MNFKTILFHLNHKALCLVFIGVFSTLSFKAQWAQKAPFSTARDGAICFAIGTKVYCGGGESKKDFRAYDPSTNSWTVKAALPGVYNERAFGVGLAINGKGYVGLGSQGSTPLADWWEYDPSTDTWTQKASYPVGRNACGYFVVNNKAYVCGGTDNTYIYGQFYEYDPALDQWTVKASYPTGYICFPYSFALNGKGYLSGGAGVTDVSDPYEYDPSLNTWTAKSPIPFPRQAGVSFVIDTMAYCGLGMFNYTTPYTDFFTYDAAHDQWYTLSPPNTSVTARAWPSAAAINNKAYIGLGWDLNNTFYSDWWELTVGGTSTLVATSIKANTLETGLVAVYPNPFSETLHVKQAVPGAQVEIYNVTGELFVKQLVDQTGHIKINSLNWAPGLYTIKVRTEQQSSVQKVIRE